MSPACRQAGTVALSADDSSTLFYFSYQLIEYRLNFFFVKSSFGMLIRESEGETLFSLPEAFPPVQIDKL